MAAGRLLVVASALAAGAAAAAVGGAPAPDTETQHAICVVTSEGAVATARATITRAVNTSCSAGSIERFSKLEKDIADQNHMIRYLIHLMEMHYNQNHDKRYLRSSVDSSTYKIQEETLDNYAHLQSAEPSSREAEIDRYNSSLLTDPQGRLTFNYYWRVHHVFQMPENTTVRSQSFYVSSGSYRMYLIYRAGTFLHMAGIGLTHGEHDTLLPWPFNLTIRLSILAQNHRKDNMQDFSSPSIEPARSIRCHNIHWQKPHISDNPSCFILIYSRDLLHTGSYLYKDTVLLHLSVLLVK
ncbi:TNF receptor-associated factor 6-like [Schistocerca gregaria]|uniref:TNF receptor-associated factor 6-like n=1 Tax=Schistocerca gregaria TaxID=7010 RepID=UPI00211F0087|nr:TNF receptor-associated factor 6-like [Schistocerca gregaria]